MKDIEGHIAIGLHRIYHAVALLALPAALLSLTGCVAGTKLRESISAIEKKVTLARERGAYKCAPRELAMAEAHLEFLRYELGNGDFVRAQEHHDISLANIDHAIEITDPAECADKRVTIAIKPQLVIAKTDRDGDGILDDVDQCPDDPEDPDGFQDEDGCPDPDNDKDTILDVVDACPNEPGPANADPKKNGCPVLDRDADGIPDDVDACPDEPGVPSADPKKNGCPEPKNLDTDGDGILDVDDQCPNDPEDKDNFQDQDGCPDLDNDGDGVPDTEDECPLEPGVKEKKGCPIRDRDGDGVPDDIDACPDVPGLPDSVHPGPGCPKRVLVVVTKEKIEIKEVIQFATNKATIIGKTSFDVLDQVNAVMKSNPAIKIVIEGHTDDVGAATYNLKLSDDRAKSVMKYLVDKGLDPARVQAIGYGKSKPIATNKTRQGKAMNRRVEFKIVQ